MIIRHTSPTTHSSTICPFLKRAKTFHRALGIYGQGCVIHTAKLLESFILELKNYILFNNILGG